MFSQVSYLEVCIYLSCVPVASCLELTCLQKAINHNHDIWSWIINKVSPVQWIGRNPFLWTVLCNIRYQQPTGNVYRVLQHAFIIFFQRFPIPFRVPSIPILHSTFYSFPTANSMSCQWLTIHASVHNTDVHMLHQSKANKPAYNTYTIIQLYTPFKGRVTTHYSQYMSMGHCG